MRTFIALLIFAGLVATPILAHAHCQVPCGIYDDHARIHAMTEDATTISKAVGELQKLKSKTDAQSLNQRIRWTQTKEDHASRIITVVAEYFLTQKIKPVKTTDKRGYADYVARLTACHAVMRAAMKTKQTVDPGAVSALQGALSRLGELYPGS